MSYLKCISNALRDGEMTSDAADAHRINFKNNTINLRLKVIMILRLKELQLKRLGMCSKKKELDLKETHYIKLEYKLRINLLQKIIKM